ncbi:MAG: hypothetical protein ACYS8W_13110 [Planctomycetota bacterium]|jgi:hypothetical protein
MYAIKSRPFSNRPIAHRLRKSLTAAALLLSAVVCCTGCVFTSAKSGGEEIDLAAIKTADPVLKRYLPHEATTADSDLIFVLAHNKVFKKIGACGTTIFRFWSDTPYSPSEAVSFMGNLGDFHFKVRREWPWGTGKNVVYFPLDFVLGWLNVPTGGLVPCFWDGDVHTTLIVEKSSGDELGKYESHVDIGAWGWVPLVYGNMQYLWYEGRIYTLRECLKDFIADYDAGNFDPYLAEIGQSRAGSEKKSTASVEGTKR